MNIERIRYNGSLEKLMQLVPGRSEERQPHQCRSGLLASVVDPDPIWIRIRNPDPDPGGKK
jgi:hypothetical protein